MRDRCNQKQIEDARTIEEKEDIIKKIQEDHQEKSRGSKQVELGGILPISGCTVGKQNDDFFRQDHESNLARIAWIF